MIDEKLLTLLSSTENGVLVTIKRDGRPQLSNVTFGFDRDSRTVVVSITEDRAKARNLRRDPRVSLHVTTPGFDAWVVLEGVAQLLGPARAVDDPATEALVQVYRSIRGEHPDWDEYRRAMVEQSRVVMSFVVEHSYGQAGW
jgi:PPOX class probable F420-dependent enzyme